MLQHQPCGQGRDEINHHAGIQQRLAQLENLGFVAVVEVEHDVRPAVRSVPGDIDRRPGQRAQHQQREARQPITAVEQEVNEVGQSQNDRKILRQKCTAEKKPRERIKAIRAPIKPGAALGAEQRCHRPRRPEDQRRVGGNQYVQPVDRRQPEQQHGPRSALAAHCIQPPPQRAAHAQRQQHHWQANRPDTVAQCGPHQRNHPTDHGWMVGIAPIRKYAPPVEKGFIAGNRKSAGEPQPQQQRGQPGQQQPADQLRCAVMAVERGTLDGRC